MSAVDAATAGGTALPAAFRRRAVATLVLLAAWQGAAMALDGSFLLAGPWEVAAYIAANASLLGRALLITSAEAAAGFVIGNVAAMLLALLAVLLPRAQRLIAGLALFVFCLPLVATGPVLRVLFGPGLGPQITLAALAVYFTTFVPLLVGLRAAPALWFDLVRSYGRGRFSALRHVRLQAALPYLIAGLQIAAPAAFLGAMIGEFTGAERGMGVLVIRATRSLDAEATWALAAIAAAVSIAAYGAIGRIGERLSPGRPEMLLAPPPAPGAAGAGWRLGVLAGPGRALLLVAAVLALWTGLMELFDLSPFFAKRPWDVWAHLVTDPGAAAARAELFGALGQTMIHTVPGYLAGLALGAVLAAAIMLAPSLAAAIQPVAVTLRSVPIVTTAPLIVLALGRGPAGSITIVAVMIFFPTLVACLQGMRQAPGQVLDIFDSYAASRWQRLIHAHLPAMLPAFFASARMAVPAAVLAATVAEWLATGTGLGTLMAIAASTSGYDTLWSAIAVTAAIAAAAYAGVERIERRVLRVFAAEQVSGR